VLKIFYELTSVLNNGIQNRKNSGFLKLKNFKNLFNPLSGLKRAGRRKKKRGEEK
jgi:hypothetical protein